MNILRFLRSIDVYRIIKHSAHLIIIIVNTQSTYKINLVDQKLAIHFFHKNIKFSIYNIKYLVSFHNVKTLWCYFNFTDNEIIYLLQTCSTDGVNFFAIPCAIDNVDATCCPV